MKNINEEIKKVSGAQELDDDMLDGVSGGLVQLVNPCDDYEQFKDGTRCQHCGHKDGKYENNRMICYDCGKDMVGRDVAESEIRYGFCL